MKYTRVARWYDLLSAEPVYRAGRSAGVRGLRLRRGDTVLDVGCGTGLNFPLLLEAVGAEGRVVGVDRSSHMLDQARLRCSRRGWSNVDLVCADATGTDGEQAARIGAGFDAVLFTYTLSLMGAWPRAWQRMSALARGGARVSVVDMQLPQGPAVLLSPLARLACALGGADIDAHPWTAVERETHDQDEWSLRGGHIQVRAGTLPSGAGARS